MGDVGHVVGTDGVGNLPHFLVVDLPRIGGATTDENFGFDCVGTLGNLVVVEYASFWVDVVEMRIVNFRGK